MWFYLALLAALFTALADIARRTHGSTAQPAELSWWTIVFSLPLGLGLLLIDNEPIHITKEFLVPALSASVIGAYSGVLHFKAFKYGDVSAVTPIGNLIPIAVLGTSFVILGTVPSLAGVGGVLLVVAGLYYSSVGGKHSLTHPIKQTFKNRGSRAMLAWALLMAIVSPLMKLALESSSPAFLMFFMLATQFILMSGYLLLRRSSSAVRRIKRGERVIRRWGWHIAAIATFATISVFFLLQAMETQDPGYVLSVKRLDVLMTVLLAGLFLKEKHILRRFKGSVLAVAGVIIIVLAA